MIPRALLPKQLQALREESDEVTWIRLPGIILIPVNSHFIDLDFGNKYETVAEAKECIIEKSRRC